MEEERVLNAPSVDCVRPPTLTARLPPEVSKTTAPVAPPAEFWIVRRPPTSSGFVPAKVKVTPAAAVVSKVTAPANSFPSWGPNVMVRLPGARNVSVAANDHDAAVDASVQLPATVQVPAAFMTYALGAETATFP